MNSNGIVKGMMIGAVVGSAAMMMFDPLTPKQKKRMVRRTGNMVRNMSNTAMDVYDTMRRR